MKSIISSVKNINCASFFIGVIATLVIIGGIQAIGCYIKYHSSHKGERYGAMEDRRDSKMYTMMGHKMGSNGTSSNPYMMGNITSEKQFLSDMVLHHEAAVLMAEEVMTLNPSDRVRALAQSIISAQNKEISDMKSWMK